MAKHRKPSKRPSTGTLAGAVVTSGVLPIVVVAQAQAADWDALAECETGGAWAYPAGYAAGGDNGFDGGLQFQPSTWNAYGGQEYAPTADQASREQQIAVAERVLADQGPNAWPGCTAKLGGWWERGPMPPVAPAPSPVPAPAPVAVAAPTVPLEGWVWPVDAPITSDFGGREGGFHNGTDFGTHIGTPFHAVKSGIVVAVGPAQGYGLWVQQVTDTGEIVDYGHISEWHVGPGEYVQAGQVLGLTGNAGQSTGPHLHLRIVDAVGNGLDPVALLSTPTPVPAPAEPSPAPVPAGDGTYTIVPGDTLSGIADKVNTTWDAVYDANRDVVQDPDLIFPDQSLRIP